ncbi:MAG TPA: HlyD family efflux transporter periplasmic adaptor subunit [Nocardioides sp.]|nr:HlyD family efflux transporter periplasmic adaptor subunit [Nocardioides sp.]
MSNADSTSVLPGPLHEPDNPDLDGSPQRRRRFGALIAQSGRRAWALNAVILGALVLVLALVVWTVRGTGSTPADSARTSTVDTGSVTATVSANGNVASGTTVNVDFQGAGGIVTAILVEPGERVSEGDVLARVDDTSARQGLQSAQAQLDSAEAAYAGVVQGQTAQERANDGRTVDQAQVSVAAARTTLTSARQTLGLTTRQQDAAVSRASSALADAEDGLRRAEEVQNSDPSPEHRQAVQAARTAVTSARSAWVTARDSRSSAVLQARQQVASAQDQLDAALAGLASTRAGVAVNAQGPRDSDVSAAQAGIDSAQVAVDQARTTLEQTVLRAPVDGTVAAVNGSVGESSSDTSAASSSSSASSSTSSAGGGSSTTDASGFVTLTDTKTLQVTADVAEADIAEISVGQEATVTLEASGKEIDGTVTAVDAVETVTNNVVEYGVTVTLDRTKGVKLGQSTQVVVTTGSRLGVVRVSSSALTTIGNRTTATVESADGTTRAVEVVTGLEGDGYTEVLSGLSDGDKVVLPEQADAPSGFSFPGAGGLGGLG